MGGPEREWIRNNGPVTVRRLRNLSAGLLLAAFFSALYSSRTASLSVTIREAATGQPTPVRVRLVDAQGNPVPASTGAVVLPEDSLGFPKGALGVLYGRYDRAEGFALQLDGSFYADGAFTVELQPGAYRLFLSKGYEFVAERHDLQLESGERRALNYELERWIDMPSRGWYSADDHIHLRRSPREDPLILRWIAAEDVHVGHLLQMGDFWATYYSQYAWGEEGRYREGRYLLSSGQEEPRTPEIGHTISLGAGDFVRFRDDYYSYDRVFDRVHGLGGVTGFAHQGMSFHGYRGLTLNVLKNKVDFLELLQFCVRQGPLALDHYYHFLDLGFRLTATAGSDFPWCGRGPRFGVMDGRCSQTDDCSQIGDARFYTYVGKEFSFEGWLEAVREGRTFVSSGPMLEFTVNGEPPGTPLEVPAGSPLQIRARALGHPSQIPLERLEIIAHGRVLKSVSASEAGQSRNQLELELEWPATRGMWIAARCQAAPTQVAHTTPVYVSVGGRGFHSPDTAGRYLALCEEYLKELEEALDDPADRLDQQASRHRATLERQIEEVRQILQELSARLL